MRGVDWVLYLPAGSIEQAAGGRQAEGRWIAFKCANENHLYAKLLLHCIQNECRIGSQAARQRGSWGSCKLGRWQCDATRLRGRIKCGASERGKRFSMQMTHICQCQLHCHCRTLLPLLVPLLAVCVFRALREMHANANAAAFNAVASQTNE